MKKNVSGEQLIQDFYGEEEMLRLVPNFKNYLKSMKLRGADVNKMRKRIEEDVIEAYYSDIGSGDA